MSNNALYSAAVTVLLAPADHANTAAATSAAWVDVRAYAGEIAFIQQTGVVTAGTLAGVIQHATDSSGTGAATLLSFTSVGTSTDNDAQKVSCQARETMGYVRYVGTIATGPAIVGVTMLGNDNTV